jgi:NH3-dependent NAD+ synthetase
VTVSFSATALELDAAAETDRIVKEIREKLRVDLRKRGLVLGISGGIDSSVCAALAVRALGPKNVFGLFTPENDSDPDSLRLGRSVAETFGLESVIEDIGPSLAAMGCYARRDDFIRQVVPEYGRGWASKIVFDNALTTGGYNISSLVVQSPQGETIKLRLPAQVYLGIVAATNMKQRTRKQLEYYHADRLNFAVIGTPNRLEYDQGFFVKNGDGAADIKPIAHLYKSAGLPACHLPGRACRGARASTNHGHLLTGPDTGRILLRAALCQNGYLPLRPGKQHCCGRDRRRHVPVGRAGRGSLERHSIQAQGRTLSPYAPRFDRRLSPDDGTGFSQAANPVAAAPVTLDRAVDCNDGGRLFRAGSLAQAPHRQSREL